MNRKLITVFIITALLAAALPLVQHSSAVAEEGVTIGLALPTLQDPFFVGMRNGASSAAEALGVKLEVLSAENDPALELENVAALIDLGVAALMLSPVDAAASGAAIALANAADVPVVLVGPAVRAETDQGIVAVTVAADQMQGGATAASLLCNALNGAGTVVEVLGAPDDLVAQQRSEGLHAVKSEDCALEIVQFETAGMDRDAFVRAFAGLLGSQKFAGIAVLNSALTIPTVEATIIARQMSMTIVGFDTSDDALSAVQQGRLFAMILPGGWNLGEVALQAAKNLAAGEEVASEILVGLGVLDLETVVRGGPRSGNLEGDPRSGRLEGGPGSGNLEGGPGSGNLEGGPGSGNLEGGPGSGNLEGGPGSGNLEGQTTS